MPQNIGTVEGQGADLIGNGIKRVATVAALRALTSATTVTTVALDGYAAAGDGGGGLVYLVSSDVTSPDNGVTIFVDVFHRRWYRQPVGYILAKWGGVVWDGSTDDTTALQKVVNVAAGLPVYLPAGTGVLLGATTFNDVPVTVNAVAHTTPIQVTTPIPTAPHGYTTGKLVKFSGVTGAVGAGLNGHTFTVTVVDQFTFTLNGTSASGTGSGGTVTGGMQAGVQYTTNASAIYTPGLKLIGAGRYVTRIDWRGTQGAAVVAQAVGANSKFQSGVLLKNFSIFSTGQVGLHGIELRGVYHADIAQITVGDGGVGLAGDGFRITAGFGDADGAVATQFSQCESNFNKNGYNHNLGPNITQVSFTRYISCYATSCSNIGYRVPGLSTHLLDGSAASNCIVYGIHLPFGGANNAGFFIDNFSLENCGSTGNSVFQIDSLIGGRFNGLEIAETGGNTTGVSQGIVYNPTGGSSVQNITFDTLYSRIGGYGDPVCHIPFAMHTANPGAFGIRGKNNVWQHYDSAVTITNVVHNDSGLPRVTAKAHGFTTGTIVEVSKVRGASGANGRWTVTVIDANTFDLGAFGGITPAFNFPYISGGSATGQLRYVDNTAAPISNVWTDEWDGSTQPTTGTVSLATTGDDGAHNTHNLPLPLDGSIISIAGPTANFTISGFTNGYTGRVVHIQNVTGFVMTLRTDHSGSYPINRIQNAGSSSPMVANEGMVTLKYFGNHWHIQSIA